MARIRSVHPGQWTDEAFVSVSAMARLLCIGLRNEADDEGVFSWKPITLKMRLLPADSVDIIALLEELQAVDIIRKYEIDGVHYGAIRNFCTFQRPKFPKSTHPRLGWVSAYCGIKPPDLPEEGGKTPPIKPDDFGSGTVPLRHRLRTASEIRPQMDTDTESMLGREGECEGEGGEPTARPASPDGAAHRQKNPKRIRSLADLVIDPELETIARENGRNAAAELDRYRDWLKANGKRQDDYRAGFRNWLRSAYGPRLKISRADDYRMNPKTADIPG